MASQCAAPSPDIWGHGAACGRRGVLASVAFLGSIAGMLLLTAWIALFRTRPPAHEPLPLHARRDAGAMALCEAISTARWFRSRRMFRHLGRAFASARRAPRRWRCMHSVLLILLLHTSAACGLLWQHWLGCRAVVRRARDSSSHSSLSTCARRCLPVARQLVSGHAACPLHRQRRSACMSCLACRLLQASGAARQIQNLACCSGGPGTQDRTSSRLSGRSLVHTRSWRLFESARGGVSRPQSHKSAYLLLATGACYPLWLLAWYDCRGGL